MSKGRRLRLNQVAREFNVGISTITEFLATKDIKLKTIPSTIVDAEAYSLLEKEFGSNRAEERVNIRERINVGKETITLDDVKEDADKKESESDFEDEVVIKSPGTVSEKDTVSPKDKVVARGPKFVGKIELDKDNLPVTPKAKKEEPKAEKREEPKKEAVKKAEPKKKEPVKEVKKAEAKPAAKPAAKSTAKPAEKPVKKAETAKKAEPKAAKAEKKVEPKKAPAKREEKESKVVVQKKTYDERQAADDSNLYRSPDSTLSGPKVVGKIDVEEINQSRGRRGKRKRITKDKVDVSKQQEQRGGRTRQGRRRRGPQQQASEQREGARRRSRRGRRQPVRPEVSEEEVQQQIKQTLARLTSKGSRSSRAARHRRERRAEFETRREEARQRAEGQQQKIEVTEFVTVSELATMMDVEPTEVIAACMNLGLMVSINQRLDAEALTVVAEEFGYEVDFVAVDIQEAIEEPEDDPEDLESRSPIVTVMGHVDHGKTSLLDKIRQANVTADEAGGITQHIGAYSVEFKGRKITFLDTPGHEAFTAMRARGAKITDVVIIIVAADDNVMPQTVEAINHAVAADVPIVFAINKIDKESANPEKIKEKLAQMNYLVEDWGGTYQSQEISAKQGLNLDKLLEKVLLETDLLELKANPDRKADGVVIESSLDRGRGYVTTVLIQQGTLHIGDVILSGQHSGRVKALYNEHGKEIEKAGPSTPVVVLGLDGAPQAGDTINVMDDDRSARELANKREQLQRMQGIRTQKHITLDEIGRRIAIGNFKELNIIVKGDVDGSIEAITDSLLKLSHEEVQVNVIHKAVGQISESDVILATASNAIIVGFQVRPSVNARRMAEQEEIEIRQYSIIYDVINDVEAAIKGMLEPIEKEEIVATVEVLETFKISRLGTIAGCIVREGKITRNTEVRVIRDGIVIYTGKLGSLKRYKDDVREVPAGMECGLNIENFNDIKVGDMVEGFQMIEVERTL